VSYKKRYISPERYVNRDRDPNKIEQFLNSIFKSLGIADKIAEYQFVTRWSEIMGEDIAAKTRPEYIEGKTLVVRVCNSVWAQELSFRKNTILGRLKKAVPELEKIEDVNFYVGDIK
jgi:predicted nucleic acid-binding Zn ribbon protein